MARRRLVDGLSGVDGEYCRVVMVFRMKFGSACHEGVRASHSHEFMVTLLGHLAHRGNGSGVVEPDPEIDVHDD